MFAQHYASRQQRPGRAPSLSLSQLWWIADVYDWKDTLIHSAAIPPLTSWPSDGVVRNQNPLFVPAEDEKLQEVDDDDEGPDRPCSDSFPEASVLLTGVRDPAVPDPPRPHRPSRQPPTRRRRPNRARGFPGDDGECWEHEGAVECDEDDGLEGGGHRG